MLLFYVIFMSIVGSATFISIAFFFVLVSWFCYLWVLRVYRVTFMSVVTFMSIPSCDFYERGGWKF